MRGAKIKIEEGKRQDGKNKSMSRERGRERGRGRERERWRDLWEWKGRIKQMTVDSGKEHGNRVSYKDSWNF